MKAWYQVISISFGYLSALIILLIAVCAVRKYLADEALFRRIRKQFPQAGYAGFFSVGAGKGRKAAQGNEIRIPYEGTLGSAVGCDVSLPIRHLHLRSAFFWMDGDGLHIVPIRKDGFLADRVPVLPGDEAILRNGAVLEIGETKLVLHLYEKDNNLREKEAAPYVTRARRIRAHQGKGNRIGDRGIRRGKKDRNNKGKKRDRTSGGASYAG